jgi:glycosyltransferase EpsF
MELMRYWHRRGAGAPQIDILATSGNVGLYDDEARSLGAKIFYLRFGRANLLSFVRDWRRILKNGAYRAVHDHQEYISGWHFLAGAGLLPTVRVTHIHNPILGFEHYYAISGARRLTASLGWVLVDRFATHICGTSVDLLGKHGYRPGEAFCPSVSVVHCGFNIGTFNGGREVDRESVLGEFGWPSDSKIVLSVGRLDQALDYGHVQNHKNSWFALNIVRIAAERDHSLRYLMAGAGDAPRSAMEQHVRSWGMEDNLRLIGVRNDVPRLMRAADVLLFPSVEEGLGMAAVEAQAAGLPVLASTAVPREAIVVPELYNTVALDQPLEIWANTLRRVVAQKRPSIEKCRRTLENSEFSITNSARHLAEIYLPASP